MDLRMDIAVEDAIVNRGGALAAGPDFLQMRAQYHVTGTGGRAGRRVHGTRGRRNLPRAVRVQPVPGRRPQKVNSSRMSSGTLRFGLDALTRERMFERQPPGVKRLSRKCRQPGL